MEKFLNLNFIKSSIIISLIYCLLFNSSVIWYKIDQFNTYEISFFLELAHELALSFLFLFILLTGLSINYYLLFNSLIFLFITGSISSYYIFSFKIIPTLTVIESVFATNTQEVLELLSVKLIIWIIFNLTILFYIIKKLCIKYNQNNILHKILCMILICYIIFFTILSKKKAGYANNYLPFIYLRNAYLYGENKIFPQKSIDISRDFEFFDQSNEDIIGVLVIGESARYDHFSINGYERETTPNLKKIPNLWSFQATSCANGTFRSISCMLSRHEGDVFSTKPIETSIISVLKKLSFNPLWIGTQSILGYYPKIHNIYEETQAFMIPNISSSIKTSDYDEKLLPFFKAALKERSFIILHTNGSHWKYHNRYPNEFTNFSPVCKTNGDHLSCKKDELINSYDNSILYTDFILDKLISFLKDKNAFLIYVSDHGESLGENGVFYHGSENFVKEQYDIPFIIWASDKFIENNPSFKHHIENNIPKLINHDYIFHSILGCLNINSTILNKSLSLCPIKN